MSSSLDRPFKKISLVSLEIEEISRHHRELTVLVDKLFEDVDSFVDPILKEKGSTILEIRAALDSIESIKVSAYVYKTKINRLRDNLKEEYEDSVRKSLSSSGMTVLGRASHYDERRAEIETQFFDLFNKVRKLSRCSSEVESLLEYIKDREKWLRDVRFELVEAERNLRYLSGSDYSS